MLFAIEDGTLLAPETNARMFSVPFPELSAGQAHGWNFAETDDGTPVVYRTGSGMGYTGYLMHYPDRRITGALLVNLAEFDSRLEVLNRVLAPYVGKAVTD